MSRRRGFRTGRRSRWSPILLALVCAAGFEIAYAIGVGDLLAQQVGDLKALAASMSGYYMDPCEGVDCDDGNACTTDSCSNGSCVNEPIDCDDGDPCTADSCDASGACVHDPIDCDDGDPCTTDFCDASGACVNEPVDCDDGDACTADSCDASGNCVHDPIDCDDGDACNGIETCDPAIGCVSGTPVDCDDGTVCTDDTCDPSTGLCDHTPANEGACCEADGSDCTRDICENGACVHPTKDDPFPLSQSVNFSFSKKFGKNLKLPFMGKAVGFGTEFGISAKAALDSGKCSLSGEVGGMAKINATFIGNDVTIDGEAAGSWGCAAPVICTTGCDNRKECDEDRKCCTAEGSGTITVNRGFSKRIGVKVGSIYVNGSVGGGLTGGATKDWPACNPNSWSITLGPVVQGSAGGGFELCNGFTKRICGCRQGRDKWTGRFTTACSSCRRCTPFAEASVSGKISGTVTWKSPGGFSGAVNGKGCVKIGGVKIGPVKFDGYQACVSKKLL